MNKDNEILFEIKDYDYIVKTMSLLITAYISIPIMMALGMSFEDKGLFSLRTIVVMGLVGTTIFFTFNLYFFKKRKVLFYENKIELKKTFSKSEIITIDVKEVYKILPFNLNSNKERRLYRWNLFRKLVLLLTFPVIIPILCIYAIATYISSFIIFKSFLFDRYRIIVIGKNEKDFLVFYYTGNNELELNIYFRRKLGLEVKRIEPLKGFFIPQY